MTCDDFELCPNISIIGIAKVISPIETKNEEIKMKLKTELTNIEKVCFLIDSGAQLSLLRHSVIRELNQIKKFSTENSWCNSRKNYLYFRYYLLRSLYRKRVFPSYISHNR